MYAEVQSTHQLTPDLLRVVLAGGTLDEFEASAATDAYINARFVPQDSPVTVPFVADDLDALPPEQRPRPRRFTTRRWDPDNRTLCIDFVVHGDAGYAGSWAQRACPGDRLQFDGPGGSYRPSADVDWHLLVGDESAFGAIGATLESLAPGARAEVFALVEKPGYEVDFPSVADVALRWLYRENAADPESVLVESISDSAFPAGTFDVFVHGEAGEVRAIRRHLVDVRRIDPAGASISPYWRRNRTDEAWRKVKRQFMSDHQAAT